MSINTPYKIANSANRDFVLDCKYEPKDEASIHKSHGGENQVFYLESNGAGYLIRAKHNAYVLEVPPFSDGSDGEPLKFAPKSGSDRQRWAIHSNGNGAMLITGYNSKNFGPKEGTMASLTPVVLQSETKPTNTWVLIPI